MASINSIKKDIEYSKMISIAERLTEAAEACSEAGRNLSSVAGNISDHWKGGSGSDALQAVTNMKQENDKIYNELMSEAKRIRQKAANLKAADKL